MLLSEGWGLVGVIVVVLIVLIVLVIDHLLREACLNESHLPDQ